MATVVAAIVAQSDTSRDAGSVDTAMTD